MSSAPARAPWMLLTALTLVLAGCTTAPTSDNDASAALPPRTSVDYAEALFLKHDHLDPFEHAGFSFNVTPLAYLQLVPAGQDPGAHAVDIFGDYAFVKTNQAHVGFFIIDIRDPANASVIGSYEDASVPSGDRTLEVSADGKTVFLGSEGSRPGVHAVDISDPTDPTFVDFFELPRFGAHTIYAHATGGRQFVYAVSFGVQILEYRATPAGMKLMPLGRYQTASDQLTKIPGDLVGDGTTYAIRDLYGHDLYVEDDPVTGQTLLYVAFAYEGLRIVDVSTPEAPVEVSRWVPGGEGAPWYVHTIYPTFINDRRILVIGSEVFENRHVDIPSPVWFVDATDLAAPRELTTWTNPAGVGSANLLMSAHDFRIEGTLLYLTHYHGGFFVLDIAIPEAPVVVAFHLTSVEPGHRPDSTLERGLDMGGLPLAFDVGVKDGIAYVADLHTGLHVLRVDVPKARAEGTNT